jgi:hypothetical protein
MRAVELPPFVAPSRPEQVPELDERNKDQTLRTLARRGVSLDIIFSAMSAPGGLEYFNRFSVVDELLAHGNLESLFPIKISKTKPTRKKPGKKPETLRRDLLELIYEFRSGNVHEGLQPRYRGFNSSLPFRAAEDVRRGFYAEFAEHAILAYSAEH